MNSRYFNIVASIIALMAGGGMLAPAQVSAAQQGVEELTRGPIHEAFAASVSFDPEPGILVRATPPDMIEEVPPEQRLEGDNVAWIPGYWAWDEEQSDFIWISGIWRNLPPGRQWIPGYWGQADDQWQWTSGYWADEETQEVTYLPPPPKSVESGPNVEAPSNNSIWISGNWIRREDRYAWTPGYWEPARADWIWIPAHYQWTRRGYLFIDGYWDYNVARRGVLFAPVRFHGHYYRRPGYSYTPLLVVSLNVFLDHLFVRPTYGHYYFGDYYSPRYRDNGYYASHSYFSGRRGYDPIYAHNRWEHRNDRDWERSRRKDFDFYRDNAAARPAHTWAALRDRPATDGRDKRNEHVIAQPLSRYVERADSGQRFQSMSGKSKAKYVEQRKQIREFGQARRQIESRPLDQAAEGSAKRGRVSREKLAKSPVVAKRAEELSGKDVPPKRLSARSPQRLAQEGPGKRAEQPRKPDQPGKTATDVRKQPEKTTKPDRQRGKDTKADVTPKKAPAPRSKPEANPDKSRKPGAVPSRKGEESKGAPHRAAKPEPDREVKPQPKRKADSPPQPTAKPKGRQKAEPAPVRRPEPQPKRKATPEKRTKAEARTQPSRQANPPRQATPERRPPPKPEATPVPNKPPRPREKTSRKKDSGKDPSDEQKKGRKR